MNLSFTLDEKILKSITVEQLLNQAIKRNVSAVELAADKDIMAVGDYTDILKCITANSLDVNYHIPYFANDIYETHYFSEYMDKSKEKYGEYLDLLETFQSNINNNPIIVVHGGDYQESKRVSAIDNTKRFLDFLLNEVEKRRLPFTIAIETLRKKELRNTFDNREDLNSFLNEFNCDNLKLCWDMCHDKMNFYPENMPLDQKFLSKIVYAHIHGHKIDSDKSHLSLSISDIDYTTELSALKSNSFKGSLNIELLSSCAGDSYLLDLYSDMDYLNKLI